MSTEENKSIVKRWLEEVWGQGRIDAIRDLVSQDIVDHDPAPGQPCGLAGQEWVAHGFLDSVSNISLKVDNLMAQGDRVFDHWTLGATHTGNLLGMPATGKRFTIAGADEYRFSGGKVVEIWHREDMLSMLQQLGMAPTPPQPQSFGRPNTSGGSAGGPPARMLPEADVKARTRQAFQQLIDRGDPSSIDEFFTPDFVGHYSGFPPVYGRDGFREFLSIYTTGLSDRRNDIEDMLVDGDQVGVRLTSHGRNTGQMFGMPPTGRTVAVKSLMIFRMAGDKAAEQWVSNDDLGMMQQLGVIPETAAAEPGPC